LELFWCVQMPTYEVTIYYHGEEVSTLEIEVDNPDELDDAITDIILDSIHTDGYAEIEFELFGKEFADEIFIGANEIAESILEFIDWDVEKID